MRQSSGASSYRRKRRRITTCLGLLDLEDEGTTIFEISLAIHQSTKRNIPEDLKLILTFAS